MSNLFFFNIIVNLVKQEYYDASQGPFQLQRFMGQTMLCSQ